MTRNNILENSTDAMLESARYDAWYKTPRGSWIGNTESNLLLNMLQPKSGSTLLDVGCGTGYFSNKFEQSSLSIIGIDNNMNALCYARSQNASIKYVRGTATSLPFPENSFDYASAITSLCFVKDVNTALSEMWRVSQSGIILGLLNANSFLYRQKHGRGNYEGARWDSSRQIRTWLGKLEPSATDCKLRTAVFLPAGGLFSQTLEKILPNKLLLGGFLVAYISKRSLVK
jgi:SAM-dependent methyltransferase